MPEIHAESLRLQLVRLSPTNPEHCRFIVDLYNSPSFIRYQGHKGIDSPDKAAKFITSDVNRMFDRVGYGTYLVLFKQTGRPVGTVGLELRGDSRGGGGGGCQRKPHWYTVPDLEVAVLEHVQGKGYATEASQLIIAHALDTLRLRGILGLVSTRNAPAKRVFVKAGLEHRGDYPLKLLNGDIGSVYALRTMSNVEEYGI